MKNLTLNRETVRTLDDQRLTAVRGGVAAERPTPGFERNTDGCPCPSSSTTLTRANI